MIDQECANAIARKLDAEQKTGRRHDLVVVRYKGKHVIQFGIRRGSRSLPHPHIARQLHISQHDTEDLARCPMSADEYFRVLREKGYLKNT